jgi:hypothetical protein
MLEVAVQRLHSVEYMRGVRWKLINERGKSVVGEIWEGRVLGIDRNIPPYLFTRYMKNSGSFFLTEMIAPTMEKEVAYHGPGNLASG